MFLFSQSPWRVHAAWSCSVPTDVAQGSHRRGCCTSSSHCTPKTSNMIQTGQCAIPAPNFLDNSTIGGISEPMAPKSSCATSSLSYHPTTSFLLYASPIRLCSDSHDLPLPPQSLHSRSICAFSAQIIRHLAKRIRVRGTSRFLSDVPRILFSREIAVVE